MFFHFSNVKLIFVCVENCTCVLLQGQFEIVTLSGSFSNYEVNGSIERTGSLTVALAGPNAQILGGLVGRLVAVTPVQVTKYKSLLSLLESYLSFDS